MADRRLPRGTAKGLRASRRVDRRGRVVPRPREGENRQEPRVLLRLRRHVEVPRAGSDARDSGHPADSGARRAAQRHPRRDAGGAFRAARGAGAHRPRLGAPSLRALFRRGLRVADAHLHRQHAGDLSVRPQQRTREAVGGHLQRLRRSQGEDLPHRAHGRYARVGDPRPPRRGRPDPRARTSWLLRRSES